MGQQDDVVAPMEDFNLMITLTIDEAIEFVLDERMTRSGAHYFLSYLCLRLGELLRGKKTKQVQQFIRRYHDHPAPLIRQLCARVKEAGSPFSYSYWCLGGLANELLPHSP